MQYATSNATVRHASIAASSIHHGNGVGGGNLDNAVALPVRTRHQTLQQDGYVYGPMAGGGLAIHDDIMCNSSTSSSSPRGTHLSKQRTDFQRHDSNLQSVGVSRVMTSPKAGPVPMTTGQFATRKRPQQSAVDGHCVPVKSSAPARGASLRVKSTEHSKSHNEFNQEVVDLNSQPGSCTATNPRIASSDLHNKFRQLRQVPVTSSTTMPTTINDVSSYVSRRQMSSESSTLSMTASTAGHVTPGRPADGSTTLAAYLNVVLESEIRQGLAEPMSSQSSVGRVPAVDVRDSGSHRSTKHEIRGSSYDGRYNGERPALQSSNKHMGGDIVVRQVRLPLDGPTEWSSNSSNHYYNKNNNNNHNNKTMNEMTRSPKVPVVLQVEPYSNGHQGNQAISNGYNDGSTGPGTSHDVRKLAPSSDFRFVRSVASTTATSGNERQFQIRLLQNEPQSDVRYVNNTIIRGNMTSPNVSYHLQQPQRSHHQVIPQHSDIIREEVDRELRCELNKEDHSKMQLSSSSMALSHGTCRQDLHSVYQSANVATPAVTTSNKMAWSDTLYQGHQSPVFQQQQQQQQQKQQQQQSVERMTFNETPINLSQPRGSHEPSQSQNRPVSRESCPSQDRSVSYEPSQFRDRPVSHEPRRSQNRPVSCESCQSQDRSVLYESCQSQDRSVSYEPRRSRARTISWYSVNDQPRFKAAQREQPLYQQSPAVPPSSFVHPLPTGFMASYPPPNYVVTMPGPHQSQSQPHSQPLLLVASQKSWPKVVKIKVPSKKPRRRRPRHTKVNFKQPQTSKTSPVLSSLPFATNAPVIVVSALPEVCHQPTINVERTIATVPTIVNSSVKSAARQQPEVTTIENYIVNNLCRPHSLSTYDLVIVETNSVKMYTNCFDKKKLPGKDDEGPVPLDLTSSAMAQRLFRERRLPPAPTPLCDGPHNTKLCGRSLGVGATDACDGLIDLTHGRGPRASWGLAG